MSSPQHGDDLGAGKVPSPRRSASARNLSSDVERQLNKGADASTFTSRESLQQPTQPAGQSDTAAGSQKAHVSNIPDGTAAGGSVPSGAAPQRIGTASSGLVVRGNPLPIPTKSKPYWLDPGPRQHHGWGGGASTLGGWNAYSMNPEADFDVARRRL